MGIVQTLDAVISQAASDPAKVELFVRSALREPFDEIRSAAVAQILKPQYIYLSPLLFQAYAFLPDETRGEILRHHEALMPYVRVALASKEESVRVAGCEFLKQRSDPNAAELLTSLLGDSSERVRNAALQALDLTVRSYLAELDRVGHGEDGVAKHHIEEKRPAMIRTLAVMMTNFNLHKDEYFVEALIRLGRDTYAVVVKILLHHRYEPVCRVLCHVLATAASPELLFRLFMDRNTDLHEMAVDILKKRPDPAFARATAVYLDTLPEEEFQHLAGRLKEIYWWEGVRHAYDMSEEEAGSMMNLILKASMDDAMRHEYFLHFFESPHGKIRQQALESLRNLEYPRLADLCARALDDPEDSVKLMAGMMLVKENPRDKVKIFGQLLQNIQDETLRKSIMKELSKGSFERYVQSFDKLDPQTRQQAARAIAKIDDEMVDKLAEEVQALDPARRIKALQIIRFAEMGSELKSAIMEVLRDPDLRVRSAGIKIIGLTAGTEAIKALMEALNDSDRRIRANAIETFEELKDSRYSSLLVPFMKDPDNRVRANAAKALWTLGHREVTAVLEEMLADPDETMRLSAVWAIGEIRYEGAARALQAAQAKETSSRVWSKIAETLKEMNPS